MCLTNSHNTAGECGDSQNGKVILKEIFKCTTINFFIKATIYDHTDIFQLSWKVLKLCQPQTPSSHIKSTSKGNVEGQISFLFRHTFIFHASYARFCICCCFCVCWINTDKWWGVIEKHMHHYQMTVTVTNKRQTNFQFMNLSLHSKGTIVNRPENHLILWKNP